MIFDQICRFLLIRPQNSQATLLPLRPFNQTTGFLFVGSLDSSIQVSISDNCCFGWITPRHLINFPNPKRDQRKKSKTIQNRTMGSCSSVFFRFFLFIWGLSQPWNWLKHKWATKRTIAWFWKQRWNYGSDPWNDDGPNGSWINWWTRTKTARLLTFIADGHHQSLNYG